MQQKNFGRGREIKMAVINILGTDYEILFQTEKENPKMEGNDGICEPYSHKIILDVSNQYNKFNVDNIEDYFAKVLRHEIIHAFFFEAGLESYGKDEMLVEVLAKLLPKIVKAMRTFDSSGILQKELRNIE